MMLATLYLWGGQLLIRTIGGVTGLATSAACCCGEKCQTCCGGSYDGPQEFRLSFADGGFSGGENVPAGGCDCCDCVEASLSNPVALPGLSLEDCKWAGVVDICRQGVDNMEVLPGQVILQLTCSVVGGVEVVTATLTWEIHAGSFATWQLVGFDCNKTSEDPNVLTNTSTDGCDTVPNEAHIWGV